MRDYTETKIHREWLEASRHRPSGIRGYFPAYCDCIPCCDNCNWLIRLLCKLRNRIEDIQTKHILRICKEEKE